MELTDLPVYRDAIGCLSEVWHAVRQGGSLRACIIEGDSGMWKSRVVLHFLNVNRIPAVVGRASQVPDAYLPLRLALESLLQLDEVQVQLRLPRDKVSQQWQFALTALASAIPLLKSATLSASDTWKALAKWEVYRLPVVGTRESDIEDSVQGPEALTLPRVFAQVLGEFAVLMPTALFIDDFDLSDASTLEALRFSILPVLEHKPIMIVVAQEGQTLETEPILHDFVNHINERYVVQHVLLPRLSEGIIGQIVAARFPKLTSDQVEVLRLRIHAATGGLMAEVEDTLRWLEDLGEQTVSANPPKIPHHDQLMIQQFAELTDAERDVLRMASVQGRYFCLPGVAYALSMSTTEIDEVIRRLETRPNSWIHSDSKIVLGDNRVSWYRFRGRQRYERTFELVPEEERSISHLFTARALEEVYQGHESSIAGLLATQFERAGAMEDAAKYFAILADQANFQGDFPSGMMYAQRGLDNLEGSPDLLTLKCRLTIEKGKALRRTDQATLALSELEHASHLADEIEDISLQLDSSQYLGELLFERKRWDEGVEYLSQTLELAKTQRNWTIVAAILENMRELYFKSAQDGGKKFIELCKVLISEMQEDRTSASSAAVAEIFEDVAWIEFMSTLWKDALGSLDKAFESLRQVELPSYYAETYCKLHLRKAEVLERINDFVGSLSEAEQALTWANLGRQRKYQVLALKTKANALHSFGRIEDAELEFESALRLLENTSDLAVLADLENGYGWFLSLTGRRQRAKLMYEGAAEHSGRANNYRLKQVALNNLGAILKYAGEFDSSLAAFRQLYSEALSQERPDKSRQSLALNHMGEILRIQNRLSDAEKCHRQAIRLADEMSHESRKAFSMRYLGQDLLAQWENDQARQVLEAAIRLGQTAHALRVRHQSRVFLARVILNMGDPSQAGTMLAELDQVWYDLRNLEWQGITGLNRGLVFLSVGQVSDATRATSLALKAFEEIESWRTSESYHLLGRCHLALGECTQAMECLVNAKKQFMSLKLFHRVYQTESTELYVDQARNTLDWSQWRVLGAEELRSDFNHMGI